VGLGIAFGLFCVVHFLLYGNFAFIKHMQALAGATDVKPADIFSMTATALGGFTIGGVAVMQYRKHKWAEYQAKMDEDSRTGERLGKAIEHLSEEQKLHTRLGAIYEFKNLAEDSPRNKENIVQILTAFIKSYEVVEGQGLPQDVEAAARVLSQLTRELIEETAEKASKENRLRPPQCVFDAARIISGLGKRNLFHWPDLKASWLKLVGIELRRAQLYGAHLKCTDLMGADLECTHFSEAHLEGANLVFANLDRAIFPGACFDEETIFCYCGSNAIINDLTVFDPGVREKYFPDFGKEKEPEHD